MCLSSNWNSKFFPTFTKVTCSSHGSSLWGDWASKWVNFSKSLILVALLLKVTQGYLRLSKVTQGCSKGSPKLPEVTQNPIRIPKDTQGYRIPKVSKLACSSISLLWACLQFHQLAKSMHAVLSELLTFAVLVNILSFIVMTSCVVVLSWKSVILVLKKFNNSTVYQVL